MKYSWRRVLSWQLPYDHTETNQYGVIRYYNKDNELHNLSGPAVIHPDGRKYWYVDGKKHRTDGPAFEDADGYKEYYINDKLHRTDGPAVIQPDGSKAYFVENRRLSEEEFNRSYSQIGLDNNKG